VKTTNGSALTSSVSSNSQTSPQARVIEIVGLMLLGVVAVAVHAAGRNRFELPPGHQGLTWIALLMVASSDRTRFLLVCFESVFCASCRTMILPLKTA